MYSSGTVTSTLKIGSSKTALLFLHASRKAMAAAVLNAISDESTRLREREQLAGGGVAPAGVQDGADDRARGGGRRSQPALVGEVAAGGDLEGQVQASGELPGRLEGPGDTGEDVDRKTSCRERV